MTHLFAVVCAVLLLAGCGADRPLVVLDADEGALATSAPTGLGAPSNFTSTAVSPTQIDLAWKDNSSKET